MRNPIQKTQANNAKQALKKEWGFNGYDIGTVPVPFGRRIQASLIYAESSLVSTPPAFAKEQQLLCRNEIASFINRVKSERYS